MSGVRKALLGKATEKLCVRFATHTIYLMISLKGKSSCSTTEKQLSRAFDLV
jgi:hypothetical protein